MGSGTIFDMHFINLLIVAAIFDDVVVPEVEPRHRRKERAGNCMEWMEEATITNDSEEHSLSSI
jgi:hypothetical protein